MKVLIVKPSSLGDVIHAFPAVELLRRGLGDGLESLTWVVNESLSGILELYPAIDRVVKFPRSRMFRSGAMREFLSSLREEQYDVCIDFQGLLRSGLISLASRAPRRIGFRHAREFSWLFYTDRVVIDPSLRHAVDKNIALVRSGFGLDGEVVLPELRVGERWLSEADGLLAGCEGDGPVLAVGCSSRWASKNWPVGFFAKVLDGVSQRLPGVRIWLLGSASESELVGSLRSRCRVSRPLDLSGRSSMMGLVGLLSRSAALLTNDSGPMHIAAALGCPCVALFGSTDPKLTGPYGDGLHCVIRSGCPSSPCFKKTCPRSGVECSQWTNVEDVVDQVVGKLSNERGL